MKLGLSSAAAASSKDNQSQKAGMKRKGRRNDDEYDMEKLEEVIVLLAKSSLANHLQLRKLTAIAMQMFMVKVECELTTAAKAEVDVFIKEAKAYTGSDENKLATIGIPSIKIFNQWVQMALSHNEGKGEAGAAAV